MLSTDIQGIDKSVLGGWLVGGPKRTVAPISGMPDSVHTPLHEA